jgi:uncharacterized protein YdcH (DUF465 family)
MNAQPHDLKDELLRTDEEFHNLAARHHELDDRLHELISKHYLSEPEQLEEVTLKKKKLQLKDQMEDILRRHRMEHA